MTAQYFLTLFIVLTPLISRGWILYSLPRESWFLGTLLGLSQDLFVIILQFELLALCAFLKSPLISLSAGLLVGVLSLYPLLDAFLFHYFQLRIKLSFFKYLLSWKYFYHSAQEAGIQQLSVLFGILLVFAVGSCYFLRSIPFDQQGILIAGLISLTGLWGLKKSLYRIYADYYNPWAREIGGLFSNEILASASSLSIRHFLSSKEAYELISESHPLLKMTHGFKGESAFTLEVDRGERPHIILISLESFRAKDLGCLGSPFHASPQFDKLAEEGVLFSNFHASGIPTARSLLGTLCGIYPQLHPRMLFESNPTYPLIGLPQILKPYGYRSCYFQSGDLHFQNYETFMRYHGFDEVCGDDQIMEFSPEATGTSWGVHDEFVYRYAAECLRRHEEQGTATFTVILSGTNHHPWKVPEGFNVPRFDLPEGSMRRRYLNTFYYSDAALGEFISTLKEMGLTRKSLILVTSDTGQPMGEHHGNYMLFNDLYQEHIHVPLLLFAEGRIGNPAVISEPCSQIDILPTVMDILTLQGVNHSLGSSLMRKLPPRTLFSVNPHARSFVRAIRGYERFTFSLETRKGELYDLETDPDERENLSEKKADVATHFEKETLDFFSMLNALYDKHRICSASTGSAVYHEDLDLTDEQLFERFRGVAGTALVSLSRCPRITDEGCIAIAESCRGLVTLHLSKLFISDKTLAAFRDKCSMVKSLQIAFCPNVTAEGMQKIIKACPALSDVDFSGCSQLNDEAVVALVERAPRLRDLLLKGCVKVSDYSLGRLSKRCPALKRLDLQGNISVSDDSLVMLSKAKFRLHTLSLLECPDITDRGIISLLRLQREVRELSLSSDSLTDKFISTLVKQLPNLYKVVLSGCEGFSEEGMSLLPEKCRSLEAIGLSHCPRLHDAFFYALKDLPLHHLFLVNCPMITDNAILQLTSLPLRNLCILDCPGVSNEAVKKVRDHFSRYSTSLELLIDRDI